MTDSQPPGARSEVKGAAADKTTAHTVFRADAFRRYMARNDRSVLPRLTPPRRLRFLWASLMVLVVAEAIALGVAVPVHTTAMALVVGPDRGQHTERSLLWLVWAPPEERTRLRIGEKVHVRLDRSAERISLTMTAVEPKVMSAETLRQRCRLPAAAASLFSGSRAVGFAESPSTRQPLPFNTTGQIYEAEVETGSRRFADLLR